MEGQAQAEDGSVRKVSSTKSNTLQGIARPPFSILEYDEPRLIVSRSGQDGSDQMFALNTALASQRLARRTQKAKFGRGLQRSLRGGKSAVRGGETNNGNIRNILATFFEHQSWENEMGIWQRSVSSVKTSRSDVRELGQIFDETLRERQATPDGSQVACPVREELFSMLFDELVRQVTVECPERGLLLLRVRDQLRMSAAHFLELYESGLVFAEKQSNSAEASLGDLRQQESSVQEDVRCLRLRVMELESLQLELEREHAERAREQLMHHESAKAKLELQRTALEDFVGSAS